MPKKSSEPGKRRFDLLLGVDLAEEILRQAEMRGRPVRAVVEDLIRQGLAAQEGKRSEERSLPLLREAIGEEQARWLEEMRAAIRADTETVIKKESNRLASLTMRAILEGGITWRLLYGMLERMGTQPKTPAARKVADELLAEARDKAHKALARPAKDEPTP